MQDWGGLIEAVEKYPELLPSVEAEQQILVGSLQQVQVLKARQEELTAQRQEVTQQLTAAVTRGKEAAIRVRSVVRGKIGPKNERLVHFKVAPIRKRPRRAKPPGESPEVPNVPGSTASVRKPST